MSSPPSSDDTPFFDDAFLAELQAMSVGPEVPTAPVEDDLNTRLAAMLDHEGTALDEQAFAGLSVEAALARTNALLEACRETPKHGTLDAVENLIVFFQALLPTLREPDAREMLRIFFHLAPALLQIAWHGFGEGETENAEGRRALEGLESVLLEIAGVRLQPTESELVLRSIDQVAHLLAAGQYGTAEELVSSKLLSVIQNNKVARALYRIMEVEVAIQVYLKERLGHPIPQIRIPDDFGPLSEYGPLQVIQEEGPSGTKTYLQLQLPDLPRLRDVLLTLMRDDGLIGYELRFDALGSVELHIVSGTWRLGLTYEPEPRPAFKGR
jgi:hypothetical protein